MTTHVNFILDESGSMSSIEESVIKGFNDYIKALKKNKKGKILMTLTKFDSKGIRVPFEETEIQKVPKLTNETFQPGASTPLYDAVVNTVEQFSNQVGEEKTLIAIMTDGYENASTEHTQDCLKDLIQKLEKQGNYTFVFLGANQNSWAVASQFGISKGNIMDWQATDRGTDFAFKAMAMNTSNLSNSNLKATASFFNGGVDNDKFSA